MWITKISIKNPVFATMMMLIFIVLGTISLMRISVDQFPNITFPVIVVQTEYPGASPESVEQNVSKKLEEAINTISGVKNISSRSYEGASVITIEFNLNSDIVKAANDVREKVALVRPSFKEGVKDPKTSRFDPADAPIMSFAVSSSDNAVGFKELSNYVDKILIKRLQTVSGVGLVSSIGASTRELSIELKPEALKRLGVSLEQVSQALTNYNLELPVGSLKQGVYDRSIQIKSKLKSVETFAQIPVANQAGGVIYLKDIANIIDAEKELESLAMLDGKRIIGIDIVKAQGENTIAVAQALIKRVEEVNKEMPEGMNIELVKDGSTPIQKSVNNVKYTILEGAALTIAIVFLFLNSWRSTVITGLTLPIALLGTFFFMYIFGFTINVITLMALSLCVGLLIDDAIVVRENIVRHHKMGKDHRQASLDGTQEIGLAVLATTFSIVAVFLPIGFMGGIIGQFFHQFGITVVVSVLISMFVSFTLDPMLSSVWPDPIQEGHSKNIIGRTLDKFDRFIDYLALLYQRLLAVALRFRVLTIIISLLILLASFSLTKFLGKEFVPAADYAELRIDFSTPVGSSLKYTKEKTLEVEAVVKQFPEVRYTYSTINSGASLGKNYASMYVKLVDKKDRTRSNQDLTQPLRNALTKIAGIRVRNAGPISAVGNDKLIRLSLRGGDLQVLKTLTQETTQKLSKINGLVDLDTSLKDDKPLYSVEIKPEIASDQLLSPGKIADLLKPIFTGVVLSEWDVDNETYDVRLKLSPEDRSLETLKTIPVINNVQQTIVLQDIADIKAGVGPNQINRKNLAREISIDANVFGRSSGEVTDDLKKVLATIKLPAGYEFVLEGSSKDMEESFGYAVQALVLAVVFIYMVLASQFGKFIQPLAIMSSLPFTLIGAILALLAFGSTLNLFSIIGVIMLMGLVTKNAILLIDYANHLREQGVEKHAALIEAAKIRLRPILMTTLAMIFGMIPLAFGLAEGSEQRAPLGQVVIGGVITSSLLTLVVVPAVYSLLEGLVAGGLTVKIKNLFTKLTKLRKKNQ